MNDFEIYYRAASGLGKDKLRKLVQYLDGGLDYYTATNRLYDEMINQPSIYCWKTNIAHKIENIIYQYNRCRHRIKMFLRNHYGIGKTPKKI